jgi:flagellar basal body rod protein FlgG
MDNGIYTTLAGQIVAQDSFDITSNNIANANTTAFKRQLQISSSEKFKDKNSTLVMPNDFGSIFDFKQGAMEATNQPLDCAINGQGFFAFQTNDGIKYGRNGRFSLNQEGHLTNANGNLVLSKANGEINMSNTSEVYIDEAGRIFSNTELVDELAVVDFSKKHFLRKSDNGLFTTNEEPLESDNFKILQGHIETANSQPILDTTEMLEKQKSLSQGARMISNIYDMQTNTYRKISQ